MGHNKPWRSEAYKEFIRFKDCVGCGKTGPNDPHHVSVNDQGWGTKPADSQCLPLCRECHSMEHNGNGLMDGESDVVLFKKMLGYMAEFIDRGGV